MPPFYAARTLRATVRGRRKPAFTPLPYRPAMSTLALDRSRPGSCPHALAHRVGLALLILLAIAPVALVDVPAMVDYPNHLARMSILARAGTPAAHPFYEVAWAPYPNLAMDLFVPPLARLIGVEAATRLFYVAGQLGTIAGAMALAFVVQGRAILAGWVAVALLYSVPFAWGFVNFQFGLAVALGGIAAWIALADRPVALRLAVHAGVVAALFIFHLFTLGLYGFAIGIWQLWRFRRDRTPLGRAALLLVGMALPALAVVVAASAFGGAVGGSRTVWGFGAKLIWLFALNGYSLPLSVALGAACFAILYPAARSGWLRLTGAGPALAAGFALLYLAMPFRLFDTAFVDVRVVVAAALILPAFATVRIPPGRVRTTVAGALAAMVLGNLGYTAFVQASYRQDYGAVRASTALLGQRARILVADAGDASDPAADYLDYPMYHAPALAVHLADAFLPTLFTYPGKQPIDPRPAMRPISVREGGPVEMAVLARIAAGGPVPPRLGFAASWTRDFDVLYVLGPPGPNPLPAHLEPLQTARRFTLFRIRPGSAAR